MSPPFSGKAIYPYAGARSWPARIGRCVFALMPVVKRAPLEVLFSNCHPFKNGPTAHAQRACAKGSLVTS